MQTRSSRLWKTAEGFWALGILCLFFSFAFGLPVVLTRGTWADAGRIAAVGFSVPAALLGCSSLLARLAARRDRAAGVRGFAVGPDE